jgi:hypothetical protein
MDHAVLSSAENSAKDVWPEVERGSVRSSPVSIYPFHSNHQELLMKIKTAASLIAAAVALLAQGAYAADAASSPTRAEVKAETAKANKEGKLMPAGDGKPNTPATKSSDTTRAAVKADTAAAEKQGKLMPAGDGKPNTPATKSSDTTRAAVKADTTKLNKEGKLLPAGDAPAGAK